MKNNAHKSVCGRIAGHGDLASISHLTLDDIAIVELNEAINAEILKVPNLEFLTLNRCKLINLDNFPRMDHLIGL